MIAGHGGRACGCACGGACSGACGRCGGSGRWWQRFARPGRGEVVDAALVCHAGVAGEVVLDSRVPIAGCLQLVTCVIDGAGHEGGLVVRQVFEYSWPEEIEVSGCIAFGGSTYTRKILCEDLFLETVDRIWDAFEVVQVGDCASNG